MIGWGRLTGLCWTLLVSGLPALAQAPARTETARVETNSLVVAEADSEVALNIRVGPADALPTQAFVRVRGLPATVSLTEGYRVAAGVWAVPLFGLPTLKAQIPKGLSGRTEILISLVTADGRMLAEAKSALVVASIPSRVAAEKPPEKRAAEKPIPPIEPQALVPLAPPAPAAKPARPEVKPEPLAEPAPVPPKAAEPVTPRLVAPVLSAEAKARLEALTAQGDKHMGQGSLAVARQFYLRAADGGLPGAAFKLAEAYDPSELDRQGVKGPVGDKNEARRWYQRAKDLGIGGAEARLQRLGP